MDVYMLKVEDCWVAGFFAKKEVTQARKALTEQGYVTAVAQLGPSEMAKLLSLGFDIPVLKPAKNSKRERVKLCQG